jgi:hypothetical protein
VFLDGIGRIQYFGRSNFAAGDTGIFKWAAIDKTIHSCPGHVIRRNPYLLLLVTKSTIKNKHKRNFVDNVRRLGYRSC